MKKRPGLLTGGGEEGCAWLFQKAQGAGHLKMVASPTSARFYQPQTLNALIVKCFVPLCLFFFHSSPPRLSHALLMVAPGYIAS